MTTYSPKITETGRRANANKITKTTQIAIETNKETNPLNTITIKKSKALLTIKSPPFKRTKTIMEKASL